MATLQTLKTSKDFQAAKKGKFFRNRIKRRLRQIVADVIHDYGKLNWNYVLIGKKKIVTEDFEDLKQEFKTALKIIHK